MISLPIILGYLGIGLITATIARALANERFSVANWILIIVVWWGAWIVAIGVILITILQNLSEFLAETKI